MDSSAWLSHNNSWKIRHIRPFFFPEWQIFSKKKKPQNTKNSYASYYTCRRLHFMLLLTLPVCRVTNQINWEYSSSTWHFSQFIVCFIMFDTNNDFCQLSSTCEVNYLRFQKCNISWNCWCSWKFWRNLPGNFNEWFDKIDFLKIMLQ